MKEHDFVIFAVQVAVLLGCALVLGQVARRLRQPAVLGEMLGGIVLGPTIFGACAPDAYAWLFHTSPTASLVRAGSVQLGMLLFLLMVGLEIDLDELRVHGLSALALGAFGSLVPLALGVAAVYAWPDLWSLASEIDRWRYALLMGVALANTANPVLARILMDLGLLGKPLGTTIMSATVVDDLIAWVMLAVVMSAPPAANSGLVDLPAAAGLSLMTAASSVVVVIVFFMGLLMLGRWVGTPLLRAARRSLPWPSGYIGVVTVMALLAAAVAEHLGLHAFLGTFVLGIALAPSAEERREAYGVIHQFVLSFFAPIFFVSLGLTTDFVADFDWQLCAAVLTLACVTKIGSIYVAGRWLGLAHPTALACGWGMNARGAIGIILASIAREQGVVDTRTYVALVVMAIATSMMAGPMMKRLLNIEVDGASTELADPSATSTTENSPGQVHDLRAPLSAER